jgi:hypothetical protein
MASAGRKKAPVPVRTTGKRQLEGVADDKRFDLTPEQVKAIHPLDPIEFAMVCARARSARLIYEQRRPRDRSVSRKRGVTGRPARFYRDIFAADIARLMRDAGVEPKLVRGDLYEDAAGAQFYRLYKLAEAISGDRIVEDPSRILRAALDIEISA